MIKGILGYNEENDRYGLLVMDLWKVKGFHCGEGLEVWDDENEKWIPTRMEMHYQEDAFSFPKKRNDGWYLVDTPFSGRALEGLRVRVEKIGAKGR